MVLSTKTAAIQEILESDHINLERLALLCIEGIPDSPKTFRPSCWRILLGYEPVKRTARSATLKKKRREYYQFVNDLLVDPFIEATRETQHVKKAGSTKKRGKRIVTATKVDPDADPLLDDPKYTSYFADNQTLMQIDLDVRRTLPSIAFFQQPVPVSHMSPRSPHLQPKLSMDVPRSSTDLNLDSLADEQSKAEDVDPPITTRRTIFARIRTLNKEFGSRERAPRPSLEAGRIMTNRTSIDENEVEDLHWESIERILFIYAKLNPGLGYVQGMNELLAPLYFVLAQDDRPEYRAHAEADTFYCFVAMMTEARDLFERTQDHVLSVDAGNGIKAVLSRFMDRLKFLDPELHQHMQKEAIEPAYFAFRWFCCMMAQEFQLPDVIRLWDSIFAARVRSGHLIDYQCDFSCALLINVRDRVLTQPFADNIKMLQHYPEQDIAPILALALALGSRQPEEQSGIRKFLPNALNLRTKDSENLFPSLNSLSNMLKKKDSEHEIEVLYKAPSDNAFQLPSNVHHTPPMDDASQAQYKSSLESDRPQPQQFKWFSRPATNNDSVPSSPDYTSDPLRDTDMKTNIFAKPSQLFRKATAFVANTHTERAKSPILGRHR